VATGKADLPAGRGSRCVTGRGDVFRGETTLVRARVPSETEMETSRRWRERSRGGRRQTRSPGPGRVEFLGMSRNTTLIHQNWRRGEEFRPVYGQFLRRFTRWAPDLRTALTTLRAVSECVVTLKGREGTGGPHRWSIPAHQPFGDGTAVGYRRSIFARAFPNRHHVHRRELGDIDTVTRNSPFSCLRTMRRNVGPCACNADQQIRSRFVLRDVRFEAEPRLLGGSCLPTGHRPFAFRGFAKPLRSKTEFLEGKGEKRALLCDAAPLASGDRKRLILSGRPRTSYVPFRGPELVSEGHLRKPDSREIRRARGAGSVRKNAEEKQLDEGGAGADRHSRGAGCSTPSSRCGCVVKVRIFHRGGIRGAHVAFTTFIQRRESEYGYGSAKLDFRAAEFVIHDPYRAAGGALGPVRGASRKKGGKRLGATGGDRAGGPFVLPRYYPGSRWFIDVFPAPGLRPPRTASVRRKNQNSASRRLWGLWEYPATGRFFLQTGLEKLGQEWPRCGGKLLRNANHYWRLKGIGITCGGGHG